MALHSHPYAALTVRLLTAEVTIVPWSASTTTISEGNQRAARYSWQKKWGNRMYVAGNYMHAPQQQHTFIDQFPLASLEPVETP